MSVRLTIKMRGEPGGADKAQVVVLDDDVITFGRDEACEVRLQEQAVSREHARIWREDSLFFLQDLNSHYGTSVNGARLPKGEKRLLTNGDTIVIAQFDVVFDRVAGVEKGEERTGHTRFISANVVRGVMQGLANGDAPYLRVMNGPRDGQKISIGAAQEYIVGRDETADIMLDDDLVSRRHVKIRRDWAGVSVEDLGSRNGLKVNKRRVTRVTLKDRDEVQIGSVKLLFIDPGEIRDAPVVMPANDDERTGVLDEPSPEEPVAQAADAEGTLADLEPETPQEPEFVSQPMSAAETGVEAVGEDEDQTDDKRRFDLSNRRNVLMLGAVAIGVLVALIMLGLLFAGA